MAHGPRALLDQAISLIQSGDLETGKRLLAMVLRQEPDNVDAWLWIATAVDNLDQRAECLRRVLAISPHNKIAWRRLAALTSADTTHGRPEVLGYEGLEFQCPKCGGEQHFHIGQQGLVCTQCGYFDPIEQPDAKVPASEQETLVFTMLSSRPAHSHLGGTMAVTCRRCGSTTTWSARHGTVQCPFCGTDIVLHASAEHRIILPQGLIPFQIDDKQARQAVLTWWGKGWLRPSSLSKRASILRLRGVYIPFWTFDHLYRAQWFETERNGAGFQTKKPREHLVMYDDMLVCGSYTMSKKMARGLEPFNTKDLALYRPAYLAGWPAEVSQISMADASIQARERMVKEIRDEFPVGASVNEVSTEYMTYKHILLPVWVGEYRYQGQPYHFAVNGQTGQVSGATPRSLALVFDLMAAFGVLIFIAVLAFVLFGPKPEWRFPVIVGAIAVWLIVFAVYFLTMAMGWRDADISRTVREAPEHLKEKSLSPSNKKIVEDMVDELTE